MRKKIKYILYDYQDLKVLINSNKEFTSYALYTQYWVSPNLALAGSIAPYIAKNDLYHYQYIGVNFHHYRNDTLKSIKNYYEE